MGSEVAVTINKLELEKTWANHAARMFLGEADKTLWNECRYTVRPFVYFDKILVVWQAVQGQPQVKDVLTVTGVDCSFQDGLWVSLQSKVRGGSAHRVTHVPRRIPGLEIFAWVPYFVEARFVSPDWDDPNLPKNMRLSLCLKSRSSPQRPFTEGDQYVQELHVFRGQFPRYSDTRF